MEDSQLRDTGRAYDPVSIKCQPTERANRGASFVPDPSNLAKFDSFSRPITAGGDMMCVSVWRGKGMYKMRNEWKILEDNKRW